MIYQKMRANNLQEIREKLNILIEKGAEPEVILQVSVELDQLIEDYMEKQRNDQ